MSTATEITLIQPMQPERDAHGWWSHPGIPDTGECMNAWNAWIEAQGLRITTKMLEDEPDTNPVWEAYFEDGSSDISTWEPTPPLGDDWFTLSIHDTEDGPVWVWARREGARA